MSIEDEDVTKHVLEAKSREAQEIMGHVFSFPQYFPVAAHPNICMNSAGEWMFMFSAELPDQQRTCINLVFPIPAMDAMVTGMREQIDHFHATGGQKSHAN